MKSSTFVGWLTTSKPLESLQIRTRYTPTLRWHCMPPLIQILDHVGSCQEWALHFQSESVGLGPTNRDRQTDTDHTGPYTIVCTRIACSLRVTLSDYEGVLFWTPFVALLEKKGLSHFSKQKYQDQSLRSSRAGLCASAKSKDVDGFLGPRIHHRLKWPAAIST
jgi:hypothetical protein